MSEPAVFLITDPRWSLDRVEAVLLAAAAVLPRGSLAVQLRDKASSDASLGVAARRLRVVTARVGALLVVNAPSARAVELAAEVEADGAHVPCLPARLAEARARLGPRAFVSTPAHADEELAIAASSGATAALVSPIFASPGKGPPRGLAALSRARALAPGLGLFALGGVEPSTAAACAEAGASGVAVIRSLLDAPDPAAAARALYASFARGLRGARRH